MIRRHQNHRPEWLFPHDDPGEPPARRWVGPHAPEPAIVQGFDLTGAMVYLAAPGVRRTTFSEPSEIDPTLPLAGNSRNTLPAYYARAYHDLEPDQRRAYLAWLADGRRAPDADRSFLRLYLNGLERRVLVDLADDPRVELELPAIMAEILALRETYGGRLAGGFADGLVQILTILLIDPAQPLPRPPIDPSDWEEPPLLRFGLGRFVAQKQPIPAEWAAVWAWYRRDVVIRSALLRTTDEFQAIFAHRYTEAYGEGLTFKPGKREVAIAYYSPNPSIGPVKLALSGIPDIFSRPAAGQKLRLLVEQVWTELGPYARAVSRTFTTDESLSMAALLPPILQSRDQPAIGEALRTLDLALGTSPAATATIPNTDLVDLWWPRSWDGSPAIRQLAAKDRRAFTALVGRFGYGVEPDPRYGKRPGQRASDDLTVFRAGEAVPPEPSPAWNAAVVAAQAG
ncbi:MAG: TerB N-terminal domain-containing protein, partial [Thermomicrobiales bacterium]